MKGVRSNICSGLELGLVRNTSSSSNSISGSSYTDSVACCLARRRQQQYTKVWFQGVLFVAVFPGPTVTLFLLVCRCAPAR
jgi:hypothetical protein